jgi:hypothetical protein
MAAAKRKLVILCIRLGVNHFSAVCTLVKVVLRLVPTPCTTAMIATAMPAAMRPYSIAVAPDSSSAKRLRSAFIAFLHDDDIDAAKLANKLLPQV